MYRLTLKETIVLAKSFIKSANECIEQAEPFDIKITRSKKSGSLRRLSMELTRKLADLRQNR